MSAYWVSNNCLKSAHRVPNRCLESAYRVPPKCLKSATKGERDGEGGEEEGKSEKRRRP
jgi:hypothetical protein